MKHKKVVLQEGEMICDKCEGTGEGASNWISCKKCLGAGKVDWIDNAMGGKKPLKTTFVTFDASSMYTSTLDASSLKIDGKSLKDYISDVASKRIAEEIDKIILEKIMNPELVVYRTQCKKGA